MPRDFQESIYIIELGFPPDILDKIPEKTLELMVIYKNVKDVAQFGGVYEP